MMRLFRIALLPVLTMSAAGMTSTAAATPRVYRNPSNSVHVRPEPCGANICGRVVWANAKAKADAAKGGTPNLIGLQLFRNFKSAGPNKWTGSVFIPDINKTFSGSVIRINATTLRGTGCLVGKMGCKSQDWTLLQ